MHNPLIAIFAAALAAWLFGAAWYMTLGKAYQAALGLDPEGCKGQKMPMGKLLVCFVAELVMATIFSWLLPRLSIVTLGQALVTGLLIGVAFMLPTVLVNNMFGGRKPMLTAIDGGHWVGVAIIQAAVLFALS